LEVCWKWGSFWNAALIIGYYIGSLWRAETGIL
jgi:hypothetical protein